MLPKDVISCDSGLFLVYCAHGPPDNGLPIAIASCLALSTVSFDTVPVLSAFGDGLDIDVQYDIDLI